MECKDCSHWTMENLGVGKKDWVLFCPRMLEYKCFADQACELFSPRKQAAPEAAGAACPRPE